MLKLEEAGIETVSQLAKKKMEELVQIPGIGLKTAEKLLAVTAEPIGE